MENTKKLSILLLLALASFSSAYSADVPLKTEGQLKEFNTPKGDTGAGLGISPKPDTILLTPPAKPSILSRTLKAFSDAGKSTKDAVVGATKTTVNAADNAILAAFNKTCGIFFTKEPACLKDRNNLKRVVVITACAAIVYAAYKAYQKSQESKTKKALKKACA